MPTTDHMLTPREAARHIGISYPTIKQWILAGKLKTSQTPGGRVPHISILRCGHSRKARTAFLSQDTKLFEQRFPPNLFKSASQFRIAPKLGKLLFKRNMQGAPSMAFVAMGGIFAPRANRSPLQTDTLTCDFPASTLKPCR